MSNRTWNVICFFATPFVVLMLFLRDPKAFINDFREFIRDNKKSQ